MEKKTEKDNCYLFLTHQAISLILYTVKTLTLFSIKMGKLMLENLAWASFTPVHEEGSWEKGSCYCCLFLTHQAISLILYTVQNF